MGRWAAALIHSVGIARAGGENRHPASQTRAMAGSIVGRRMEARWSTHHESESVFDAGMTLGRLPASGDAEGRAPRADAAASFAVADGRPFEVAFRDAFERGYPSLARYLERLTDDAATAADLAQEAFVRLCARGSMPDDPRAWLVSVAHNLLRNERERIRRRARILGAHGEEIAPTRMAPPADDAMESAERRAEVRRALVALGERERRMLLLRYEGFSYREIASALGIHEASVGTLLARAKASFRQALGESSHASR